MHSCSKAGQTSEFLRAATKTLTRGYLSTEGSLLADTSEVREATAVCRRPEALWYACLLWANASSVSLRNDALKAAQTYRTRRPIGKIGGLSSSIGSLQTNCNE